jgi:hypothetical protein
MALDNRGLLPRQRNFSLGAIREAATESSGMTTPEAKLQCYRIN